MSGEVSAAFVFTDLAGFTAFTAERGDAAALALVERFEREVMAVLPPTARVVKQLGDGFFLCYADVPSALASVAALMARCAAVADSDAPLWVRTGVHSGTALARGDDLLGHDVNVASRVTDMAGAGETLVSAEAKAASGVPAAFEPVGPVFLKGIEEPVRLFRLVPERIPATVG